MEDNRKFWERNAKRYDKLHVKNNGELYGKLEDMMRPYLGKDKDILELASGTGNLAVTLAENTKSWTGVDYSENMVREADKHNIQNAHFETGNAMDLRFEDESFDVVIIANALHVMPEPEKALSESRRVLRKGGILLCPTFIYEGHVPRFKLFLLKIGGFVTYHKWDEDTFRSFVERAGFKTVESKVISGNPLPECFIVLERMDDVLFEY